MLNAEDIIKKVEKIMKFELETGGKTQRTIQQHVGKIINHEESMLYGQTFDDMLNKIERIMKAVTKARLILFNTYFHIYKSPLAFYFM